MNKPAVPKKPVRPGFLGAIDTLPMEPANNMSSTKTADMTFRMDPKWHARFKATAALQGLTMKELLVEAFQAWEEKNKTRS